MDPFEENRKNHKIKTCPICKKNQEYKDKGSKQRVLSLIVRYNRALITNIGIR